MTLPPGAACHAHSLREDQAGQSYVQYLLVGALVALGAAWALDGFSAVEARALGALGCRLTDFVGLGAVACADTPADTSASEDRADASPASLDQARVALQQDADAVRAVPRFAVADRCAGRDCLGAVTARLREASRLSRAGLGDLAAVAVGGDSLDALGPKMLSDKDVAALGGATLSGNASAISAAERAQWVQVADLRRGGAARVLRLPNGLPDPSPPAKPASPAKPPGGGAKVVYEPPGPAANNNRRPPPRVPSGVGRGGRLGAFVMLAELLGADLSFEPYAQPLELEGPEGVPWNFYGMRLRGGPLNVVAVDQACPFASLGWACGDGSRLALHLDTDDGANYVHPETGALVLRLQEADGGYEAEHFLHWNAFPSEASIQPTGRYVEETDPSGTTHTWSVDPSNPSDRSKWRLVESRNPNWLGGSSRTDVLDRVAPYRFAGRLRWRDVSATAIAATRDRNPAVRQQKQAAFAEALRQNALFLVGATLSRQFELDDLLDRAPWDFSRDDMVEAQRLLQEVPVLMAARNELMEAVRGIARWDGIDAAVEAVVEIPELSSDLRTLGNRVGQSTAGRVRDEAWIEVMETVGGQQRPDAVAPLSQKAYADVLVEAGVQVRLGQKGVNAMAGHAPADAVFVNFVTRDGANVPAIASATAVVLSARDPEVARVVYRGAVGVTRAEVPGILANRDLDRFEFIESSRIRVVEEPTDRANNHMALIVAEVDGVEGRVFFKVTDYPLGSGEFMNEVNRAHLASLLEAPGTPESERSTVPVVGVAGFEIGGATYGAIGVPWLDEFQASYHDLDATPGAAPGQREVSPSAVLPKDARARLRAQTYALHERLVAAGLRVPDFDPIVVDLGARVVLADTGELFSIDVGSAVGNANINELLASHNEGVNAALAQFPETVNYHEMLDPRSARFWYTMVTGDPDARVQIRPVLRSGTGQHALGEWVPTTAGEAPAMLEALSQVESVVGLAVAEYHRVPAHNRPVPAPEPAAAPASAGDVAGAVAPAVAPPALRALLGESSLRVLDAVQQPYFSTYRVQVVVQERRGGDPKRMEFPPNELAHRLAHLNDQHGTESFQSIEIKLIPPDVDNVAAE